MSNPARVRPLAAGDLEMILDWRNAPSVRAVMLTSHSISLDEHRAWFDRVANDPRRRMLIVEDDTGPVGFVQFSGVTEGGVSDWGFYARPGAPKGSGTRLGRAALTYAFDQLALHKVCGQAVADNQASILLHERLGFVREGVLRDQHRTSTGYSDLICFGLLQADWSPQSPRTEAS